MKKVTLGIFLLAGLVLMSAMPMRAEGKPHAEVRRVMHQVFQAFKSLQLRMAREDEFLADSNDAEIRKSLKALDLSFHELGEGTGRLHDEPGFRAHLRLVRELMDDARNRFGEGRKQYALYRLRAASGYCISCHTTYKVNVSYWDPSDLTKLDFYQKGELLLASRQFAEAERAYLAVAWDPKLEAHRMEALRKWLVINTRVHVAPAAAAVELERLLREIRFTKADREELEGWLRSLRRLERDDYGKGDVLQEAESLLRSLGSPETLYAKSDPVGLILITARLHRAFDVGQLKGADRAEGLYLLGYAYSKLSGYFVNELPETFLIQAIEESPGTQQAKKAFALYKELTLLNFGGVTGAGEIPDDVNLNLKELEQEANGVPHFSGRS